MVNINAYGSKMNTPPTISLNAQQVIKKKLINADSVKLHCSIVNSFLCRCEEFYGVEILVLKILKKLIKKTNQLTHQMCI